MWLQQPIAVWEPEWSGGCLHRGVAQHRMSEPNYGKEGVPMGSSVGVRAHRERGWRLHRLAAMTGARFLHIRGVPDMEKELTRMSTVVLDWC